jgi:hypothetical protein
MSMNEFRIQDINMRINTFVGVRKYQEIKKVMETFDQKLQQETEKTGTEHQVDIKIK